jgi:hypothetical protein
LRRGSLEQGTADQPVEVFALAARQGYKRGFENGANDFVALAKGRLSARGEPVTNRPPWSSHALDHPALHKAIGQRAERLVGLEGHLGERVRRRVWTGGDRAKSVPLGQRRANLS